MKRDWVTPAPRWRRKLAPGSPTGPKEAFSLYGLPTRMPQCNWSYEREPGAVVRSVRWLVAWVRRSF